MNDTIFHYFLGEESEQFSFVKVPKLFFTDKRFSGLSYGAKILYGLLLDRMSLSKKNKWIDEKRRVYVIYTIESIQDNFNISKTVAVKFMKELEDLGLIERKKRPNAAALIYVKNFVLQEESNECEIPQKQGSPENGSPEVQKMEVQKVESQKTAQKQGSLKSGSPKNGIPEVQKMESNKTDINKTDIYNILSSSSYTDYNKGDLKKMIKKYIGYSCEKEEEPLAEKIMECLAQIFQPEYKGQKIDNSFIDASQIRYKILQNLTYPNFKLILKNVQETGGSNGSAIFNMQSYVIVCFYKLWVNGQSFRFQNEHAYDFEKLEKQLLEISK